MLVSYASLVTGQLNRIHSFLLIKKVTVFNWMPFYLTHYDHITEELTTYIHLCIF
jgi:hypothetical protein